MKKIFQTQKQQIRGLTKTQYIALREMYRLSKNLYNVALYSTRQYFFAEQKLLRYVCESKTENSNTNPQKALSIDLGLDNLATFVDTDGASKIIDGRHLKSINHHYNKRIAHLNSIHDHQGGDTSTINSVEVHDETNSRRVNSTTRLQCQLTIKRNKRIRDYMNKTARYIVPHCLDNQIGTLVVGYNPDWKRNLNIGRVNNQNFVSIPHGQLRIKLSNLCERYGIHYVEQEESYTSKASFPDNDEIPKWTGEHKDHTFSRKRIHRGLYRTKDGKVINADANGAANNLRKSKQKVDFSQLCTGHLASPLRIRLR